MPTATQLKSYKETWNRNNGSTNDVQDVRNLVATMPLIAPVGIDEVSICSLWIFSTYKDAAGAVIVGSGTSAVRLHFVFTCKAMLSKISQAVKYQARGAGKFVIHIDSTYKINKNGFPLTVRIL